MAERDYTSDYEDWLRQQQEGNLLEHQGIPEPIPGNMAPVPPTAAPAVTTTPTTTTPPTTTGGRPPKPTDAPEGYEWVDAYDGGWQLQRIGGGGYYTNGGGGGGGGSAEPSVGAFKWPSYAAPGFDDPGIFDPGPAFSYRDFVAPTGEDVLKDPSFQFRLDQGRKVLESSAAGKGILRSGGTMKDLLGYGQNFASQEYGNVYNRAANDYGMNRSNAADIWGKQYGQRQDVYGSKVNRSNALNGFNQSNAQFDFSGRQAQAQAEFQDAFNRFRATGDWLSGDT